MFPVDNLDRGAVCRHIAEYGDTGPHDKVTDDKLLGLYRGIWWVVGAFTSTVSKQYITCITTKYLKVFKTCKQYI